jgi:toxin ParE1/3/4
LTEEHWRIRLSDEAERDFARILAYTRDDFGLLQLDVYRGTLIAAMAELEAGPDVLGSLSRDEIHPGLRTLHVARKGRRGRHLIMYRARPDRIIDVVRILHDAMDFARHVPTKLD